MVNHFSEKNVKISTVTCIKLRCGTNSTSNSLKIRGTSSPFDHRQVVLMTIYSLNENYKSKMTGNKLIL